LETTFSCFVEIKWISSRFDKQLELKKLELELLLPISIEGRNVYSIQETFEEGQNHRNVSAEA
jgi:hypothetical protein